MNWQLISLILGMFGFLKEFRPNEPFVTDYLTNGTWKHLTKDDVNRHIYPVATYSNLATLVCVFILTDFLRYKPVIILCGVTGIVTYVIFILGTSVAAIQAAEFFYGLYLSTEVAYYTYIYAKVDKIHYQDVSSYTRSALLCGRFVTGVVGQLIVSYDLLDLHQLVYLNIAGQVSATIWALFLPPVGQSVYFHRVEGPPDNDDEFNQRTIVNLSTKASTITKIRRAYFLLWKDFIKAYSDFHVLKWSFWWAAASCGYLQVLSYVQFIWKDCAPENNTIYNGIVESLYTVIGAAAVFGVGKLRLNWTILGELILTVFSCLEAGLVLLIAWNYNIWVQYATYILFGVIYHTIVTVCSFEVAKRISDDSFGLIFGLNVFLALAIQSILTLVITSETLQLAMRTQFVVIARYFAVLGAIFGVMTVFTFLRLCKSPEKLILWQRKKNSDVN